MTGKGLLLEMANHIADIFAETLVMETGTNRRRTIAAIIFHFLRVGQINRGDIILPQMSDIQVPNLSTETGSRLTYSYSHFRNLAVIRREMLLTIPADIFFIQVLVVRHGVKTRKPAALNIRMSLPVFLGLDNLLDMGTAGNKTPD